MSAARTLLITTYREWRQDNATRLAAALSYYSALSIAPLLVLAVTIAGFFFSTEAARQELVGQLRQVMGPQSSEIVRTVLEQADQPQTATLAGLAGVAVLLWGASNVFAQLQSAMNTVWGVELKPSAGIWVTARERQLSFGIVMAIGFLLVVSLILSTLLAALTTQLGQLLPGVGWLWQAVNEVVTFVVITLLFALLFKMLPDAETAWRDVWWGALLTSALFTIGKFLLGLFLGMETFSSAYGAAGSLVVFLIWVYVSAQIFFFGAEFTQVYARRRGRGLRPADHARFAEPASGDLKRRELTSAGQE